MALHLGDSEKLKFSMVEGIFRLMAPPVFNGVTLLSSDGFILMDSNGICLTAKEDE